MVDLQRLQSKLLELPEQAICKRAHTSTPYKIPKWWTSIRLTPQIGRPQESILAVSLSGNISFTTSLKWTTSRNERLYALCNHVHKQILQQSPAWWSPGPLGSHDTYPPGDLLVLRVHTTINRLVISWSFGFTWHLPARWYLGPSGSHNNYPPGDLLVLWVHTTITRLVISWSFGFTHQSPVWWSTGALVSHSKHLCGDLLVLYVHTTITCMVTCWSFGFTQ